MVQGLLCKGGMRSSNLVPSVASLVLTALATACSPATPLHALQGAELVVNVNRAGRAVQAVRVAVDVPGDDCPTIDAAAELNGTAVPLAEPGGVETSTSVGGHYIPVPETSQRCLQPSFMLAAQRSSAGPTPALLDLDGPLTLTLQDGTSLMRVRAQAPALELALTGTRQIGSPLEFALSQPVAHLELNEFHLWRVDAEPIAPAERAVKLVGNKLVGTVPTNGPGMYRWTAVLTFRADVEESLGVRTRQNTVWLTESFGGEFFAVR